MCFHPLTSFLHIVNDIVSTTSRSQRLRWHVVSVVNDFINRSQLKKNNKKFFYWVFNTFSIITIERTGYCCVGEVQLGLELRFLLMQSTTWPPFVMGVWPPRLTFTPSSHYAATESLLTDGAWKPFHLQPSCSSSLPSSLEPTLQARANSPTAIICLYLSKVKYFYRCQWSQRLWRHNACIVNDHADIYPLST